MMDSKLAKLEIQIKLSKRDVSALAEFVEDLKLSYKVRTVLRDMVNKKELKN